MKKDKKYIVIGDIHGRIDLLRRLLIMYPSDDYFYVSTGDLNDYGDEYADISSSIACINIFKYLVENGRAAVVKSNHQDKLYRYLIGNKVSPSHGLNNTIGEIEGVFTEEEKLALAEWLDARPYFYEFTEDNKKYVVVHAYFDDYMYDFAQENDLNEVSKRKLDWFKSCCIYGMTDKDSGRVRFWDDHSLLEKISKFHLVSGHYHHTINKKGFTMVDTAERSVVYYIPSINLISEVK